MKPKVSIIVPIYNIEAYLKRCLDSLLAQTFTEIEIIAVNDGSTDSSANILEQYAQKDNRIKVFHKANGGVSSARNKGISHASGDYLGFVDPDDWVEPEMYQVMYHTAITENADIVMCSYVREFANHSKVKSFNLPENVIFHDELIKKQIMRRLIGPIEGELANPEMLDAWGTVWSKLYRTDLLKKNDLDFIDLQEIGTNEDSLFNIEACYHAKTFVFLNQPFYHYWRENDASLTSYYKPKLLEQWHNLYSRIARLLEEKGLSLEFKEALTNRICLNTMGLGLNIVSKDHRATIIDKVKKIQVILNDEKIRASFNRFELTHFPFVWKVFFGLAKHRFSLGFFFLLSTIEWLRKTVR